MAPELNLLRNRAADLAENLGLFVQPLANDAVRWLEYGRQLRLLQSPLDVSQAMQSRVLPANQDGSTETSRPNTAWVFTSATLGHDEGLSWMVDNCGLAGARVLKVPSPFDYAQQAALYVPPNFPPPGDAAHSQAVAALALQGALQLGGRTLVLTTTLRAMNSIGEALQRSLQAQAALGLTSGSAWVWRVAWSCCCKASSPSANCWSALWHVESRPGAVPFWWGPPRFGRALICRARLCNCC